MRKPAFCICENNLTDADQLRGNRALFSLSLYLLNPKFQASSHLLYLYSLDCVGPGRKSERWFSHDAAHICLSRVLVFHHDE